MIREKKPPSCRSLLILPTNMPGCIILTDGFSLEEEQEDIKLIFNPAK